MAELSRKSAKQPEHFVLSTFTTPVNESFIVEEIKRQICHNNVYHIFDMVLVPFLGILGAGIYIPSPTS